MKRITLTTVLLGLTAVHCSNPPPVDDGGADGSVNDVIARDTTPSDSARPDASGSDASGTDASGTDAAIGDSMPDVVAARCGDGVINGSDMCDDNNTMSGDGCSDSCQPEAGWMCNAASPTVCTAVCGDGMRVGAEAAMNGCDDNNMMNGDGCSSTCTVEMGFSCMGAPSVCATGCGDGIRAGMEGCDDNNMMDGDGCSMSCVAEPGYSCMGSPSMCTSTCGDGVRAVGREACDDNNMMSGDGCSDMCAVEPGFACMGGAPSTCAATCGDGMRVGAEASMTGCDDNNMMSGDGCSDMCVVEPGFTCTGARSMCAATCGDNMRVGTEACDDGNMMTETECPYGTATCTRCNADCTMSLMLTGATCGDGVVNGMEECDDGFALGGDGCSATCTREMGFTCTGAPSVCSTTVSYTGMPVVVADNTTATVTVSVPAAVNCRVTDLTMSHAWMPQHTFAGDLIIDLLTPSGAVAALHNRTGGSADLLGPYVFARTGTMWAPSGAPYAAGTYAAPALGELLGVSAAGDWNLRVSDRASGDTGSISAFSLTLTCRANRPARMERSCAEILMGNPMAANGTYELDTDGAGPLLSVPVYCDMVNGGWAMIFSSNATPTMMVPALAATPMTATRVPDRIVRELSAAATQVHIRTAGQIATRSVTSDPMNMFVMTNLRTGLTLNSNSPLRANTDSVMGIWTGPMAMDASSLWHSCGPAPFGTSLNPTYYWSCNNGNGAHIGPAHTGWTSGGAEENIEIYVR